MSRLCEGRVAIVTGGARGVGRQHALMLAEHGAKVVVNDIGAGIDGAGRDTGPAQEVVDAIKAKGGEAVVNGDDVSTWDGAKNMVDQAVAEFGTLDAVINNAGILRDRMLTNMSEDEWDAVIQVHLKGTFAPARHAAAYWREKSKAQGGPVSGRIINTSSTSGIYGNVGQSNYGAAKAGIAAFTVIAARELRRYGVTVNAISPSAQTRMTENLRDYTPEDIARRDPKWVSPTVVYLTSEQSQDITGRVIQCGNGRVAVCEGWRRGAEVEQMEGPVELGPEDPRDDRQRHARTSAWTVSNSTDTREPREMALDYDKLMAMTDTGTRFEYTDRETMLYAIGVGMGRDPYDENELPYVFEKEELKTVPSMGTVLARSTFLRDCGYDYTKVVHGEQRLTLHRPLPEAAVLIADSRVTEAYDKGEGRGAVIYSETAVRTADDNQPLFTQSSTTFARGDGGFGGPSGSGPAPHAIPEREPDQSCTLEIRKDQALLYRLNGDRNPLHADPELAKRVGFPVPILHGLCTYGTACKAVLQTVCKYDHTLIRGFDARFSSPVFPGESVTTDMWIDDDVVSFRCRVAERDVTVINNGRCQLAS